MKLNNSIGPALVFTPAEGRDFWPQAPVGSVYSQRGTALNETSTQAWLRAQGNRILTSIRKDLVE